jgi:hypothetical protein
MRPLAFVPEGIASRSGEDKPEVHVAVDQTWRQKPAAKPQSPDVRREGKRVRRASLGDDAPFDENASIRCRTARVDVDDGAVFEEDSGQDWSPIETP